MFVYLTSPKETFRYLSQEEATQLEAGDWKCSYCLDLDTKNVSLRTVKILYNTLSITIV